MNRKLAFSPVAGSTGGSVQGDDIIIIENLESTKDTDMLSITCKLIQEIEKENLTILNSEETHSTICWELCYTI